MGYYDYESDSDMDAQTGHTAGLTGKMQRVLNLGVRILGVSLLLVGLGIGVSVVLEAWALYKSPERIERFADAIEKGSNIDGALHSVAQADAAGGPGAPAARPEGASFRFSYFAAWAVALVLMLVVGTLAMSAVATGAKLALGQLGRP